VSAGGAGYADSGQSSERWPGAAPRTLQTCRAALLQILKARGREPFDPGSEDGIQARAEVYWYFCFLAEALALISDSLRASAPTTKNELDRIQQDMASLSADILAFFGHRPTIIKLVDDDESGVNIEQARQLVILHEDLVIAIAMYSHVIEGRDRASARGEELLSKFLAAFRLLQEKIEAIIDGLEDWRR
jgi:hypothetical protein